MRPDERQSRINISRLGTNQPVKGMYPIGSWCFVCFYLDDFHIFLPAVHQNYVGTDAEKSPFYLSVVLSDQNNQRVPQYRAILWRKTVSQGVTSAALSWPQWECYSIGWKCISDSFIGLKTWKYFEWFLAVQFAVLKSSTLVLNSFVHSVSPVTVPILPAANMVGLLQCVYSFFGGFVFLLPARHTGFLNHFEKISAYAPSIHVNIS